MKLMFYNDNISVASGGTERVITNLANQFQEHDFNVSFLTYVRGDVEYPLNNDVKRLVIRHKDSLKGWKRKIDIIKGIRHFVKADCPDVLITFGVGMVNRALFATIGINVKNIISYQCSPYWDFRTFSNRFLMRTLHQRTDGIVFQTVEARDYLPKRMQRKGEIIFNQVDERFYNTYYDGPKKDIVAVGRLKGMKNHRMLINAFASIADKIRDNLLIYGDGELHEELSEQIKQLQLDGRVFLKGLCDDIPEAIKSAKLFVMSSDHEGCPNALMEAMALGIPCISTACLGGGPQMLFGEDLKDCLVPKNDALAMSEKIMDVINNPQKLDEIGGMGKKHAQEFRPTAVYKKWEDYILRFK